MIAVASNTKSFESVGRSGGRDDRIRTCDFYVPKMENYGIYKIFYEYCTKNLTLFQRI